VRVGAVVLEGGLLDRVQLIRSGAEDLLCLPGQHAEDVCRIRQRKLHGGERSHERTCVARSLDDRDEGRGRGLPDLAAEMRSSLDTVASWRRNPPIESCVCDPKPLSVEGLEEVAMTVWIIIGVCFVAGLALVWWRDRRHHGRVDQRRVTDGITKNWIDEATLSRRDYYRE
jgi:hypothetical protein